MLKGILSFFHLYTQEEYALAINVTANLSKENEELKRQVKQLQKENKRMRKELRCCVKLRRCYVKKKA